MKSVVVELKGNEPDIYLITEVEEEDLENFKKLGVNFVEADQPSDKKGFAFVIPAVGAIWASLPSTATVVGAGVIGVVGGAASIVGGKIIRKIWPEKE